MQANPKATFAMPYICCLTAYSGKQYREKAFSAGIDEFYVKPLSTDDLKKLLIKRRVINIDF